MRHVHLLLASFLAIFVGTSIALSLALVNERQSTESKRHAPAYDIGQPAVCPEGTTRIDIIQGKTRSQACMGGLIRP